MSRMKGKFTSWCNFLKNTYSCCSDGIDGWDGWSMSGFSSICLRRMAEEERNSTGTRISVTVWTPRWQDPAFHKRWLNIVAVLIYVKFRYLMLLFVFAEFFKQNSTSFDSKPVNNTRDMYRACMNTGRLIIDWTAISLLDHLQVNSDNKITDAIEELGITPLVKILDSYGQWPMTVSDWTEDRFDWRKASASIRNTFGLSFLFEVSNFVDVNNTEISTLYV